MKIGLDTSVLIAAWASWHANHLVASQAIIAARAKKHRLLVASHSLKECYAVLTRLPQAWRFSPAQARDLILSNVTSLTLQEEPVKTSSALDLIKAAADRDIGGGQMYDLDILRALLAADVDLLWTYNVKHFQALAPSTLRIAQPGGTDATL